MRQWRARWAWLLYTAFIVYAATIPFHFDADRASITDKLHRLPLSPLISPDTGRRLSIPDAVQNVLFFVPFGILGYIARRRSVEERGSRPAGLVISTCLGFALSLFVESLQLLTADRVASVADVATNTIGAFAGAASAWILHDAARAGLRRLRTEGLAVPELYPLAVASTVLAIAFLQPFDLTLEVGTVMTDVRRLEQDIWQVTPLRDEGIVVVLSAFFSATLASYLSVLGERWAAVATVVASVIVLCFLEASQLFIGSRTPGAWDLFVAIGGLLAGLGVWKLTPRFHTQAAGLAVLALLTSIAASIQMLSPFELTADYRGFGWFPFRGYYTRTTFETLSHVIELMLLYFPLGFWLGQSQPNRRRAVVTGVTLTLAIAGPIEYMQGWIVGRYPDVTDLLLSVAGVWVGIAAYNGRRP